MSLAMAEARQHDTMELVAIAFVHTMMDIALSLRQIAYPPKVVVRDTKPDR